MERKPVFGHWHVRSSGRRQAYDRPRVIHGHRWSRDDGPRWGEHKVSLVDNGRPTAEVDTWRIHAAIVATTKDAGSSGEAAHGAPGRPRFTPYPLLIRAHSSWYKGKGPVGGGEDVSRGAVGERDADGLVSTQRWTVIGKLGILFDSHARE